ncbi:MAG TPA: PQQ-dependent sugar dehydrogenase [Pirellulales bacterium]|nr:PQQ-dependent sugar dehydrogenase [Pirellulales bacterium]
MTTTLKHRLARFLITPLCSFLPLLEAALLADERRADFECRWNDGEIVIDGRADEVPWSKAQEIKGFSLPWLGEPARPAQSATRARLLWDRENLYFFAAMDDSDLYADVEEPDGVTWENDVFELFFKPADGKPGYYEFQVNAAGAIMDMFVPRRGSGGYRRFKGDGAFHIEAKVSLDGTLNRWQDRDKSWSVEGRIPWTDFLRTGGRPCSGETWKFALCRYDYSVDFEGPELSTCAPLRSQPPNFHHHEDYAALVFKGPSQQTTLRPYGIESYLPVATSRVIGSPDPPLPYRAQRALPELRLSFPVFVITAPEAQALWIIDQPFSFGPTRLARTTGDPGSGQLETLLQMDEGLAYSLAFHPDFRQNGYVFLGANTKSGSSRRSTRITRYTVSRAAPYALDPASAFTIIEWPSAGHDGAALAFGHDRMLYITSGDGTSDSDTDVVGQDLSRLTAKALRIDVDHPAADRPYSVPPDNPFVNVAGARPETWAFGLRNPWRMTTDPVTGQIWIGSNGQDLWEHVFLLRRGANYGWSVFEGSHPFYLQRKLADVPHTPPTAEHPHSEARSLTGGVVYHGKKLPELRGAYLYGDYSTGKIWGLRCDGDNVVWHKELADTSLAITAFALDADGELLIADHRGSGQGGLYTLQPNADKNTQAAFPRRLSETGLFRSVAGHVMQPGAIPYDVNAPLWSDGADKQRWLVLPPSMNQDGHEVAVRIPFSLDRSWELPEQTVLVKSFALGGGEGKPEPRRWIETRLLMRQQGEWAGYSYRWNEQQTDAELVGQEGADQEILIRTADGERRQIWHFPSRGECMVCHSRAANFVLGLSALQLNRDFDYGGVVDNQLRVFEHLGLLRVDYRAEAAEHLRQQLRASGISAEDAAKRVAEASASRGQRSAAPSDLLAQSPDHYERLADPYDNRERLDRRARAYLHANCSQCHVEAGGGNAQIDLHYSTAHDKMRLIGVEPLHARFGIEGAELIAAGNPDRSVLLRRMGMRGPGQMPQLATSLVDQRAVEMIRAWIQEMAATGIDDCQSKGKAACCPAE